jgi:hypothetical protein
VRVSRTVLREAGGVIPSAYSPPIPPVLIRGKFALMTRLSRISQSISFQRCSLSFGEQGSGEPVVFIQGVGRYVESLPKSGANYLVILER